MKNPEPIRVVMTDRDDGSRTTVHMREGDVRCCRISRATGLPNYVVMARLNAGEELQTAGFIYRKET